MKNPTNSRARHRLALAVPLLIAAAALSPAGVLAQSEVCRDRKGNVIACPEKKPTPLPTRPPTRVPEATSATSSENAVTFTPSLTATPTATSSPTATTTALAAALAAPAVPGSAPTAPEAPAPARPTDGFFVIDFDAAATWLWAGLSLSALLLLLSRRKFLSLLGHKPKPARSGRAAYQDKVANEAFLHTTPGASGMPGRGGDGQDILIGGSTQHDAGVQQTDQSDLEFLIDVSEDTAVDGFRFDLMGHHMKPGAQPAGAVVAADFYFNEPGSATGQDVELPLGTDNMPPATQGFTIELKDAHVADIPQEPSGGRDRSFEVDLQDQSSSPGGAADESRPAEAIPPREPGPAQGYPVKWEGPELDSAAAGGGGTDNQNFATPEDGPPPSAFEHELGHTLATDHIFDSASDNQMGANMLADNALSVDPSAPGATPGADIPHELRHVVQGGADSAGDSMDHELGHTLGNVGAEGMGDQLPGGVTHQDDWGNEAGSAGAPGSSSSGFGVFSDERYHVGPASETPPPDAPENLNAKPPPETDSRD